MRTKIKKRAILIATSFALLFGMWIPSATIDSHSQPPASIEMLASVAEPTVEPTNQPAPKNDVVQKNTKGDSEVSNPDVLTQYGPIGTLIGIVGTGVVMIIRAINEGKKIDVETYKTRATEAENRADVEIGKVYKKLEEMETKLDSVIADREKERDAFEIQKLDFNTQVLAMETRHRTELENVHKALLVEVYARHNIEEILASRGIVVPSMVAPNEEDLKKVQSEAENLIRDIND